MLRIAAEIRGYASPAVPWWDSRYLDWFSATAFASIISLQDCAKPSSKCGELLERNAENWERDDAGHGNLFAPGLALALTYSEITGDPISKHWMIAFHDATGMEAIVLPPSVP